MTTVTDLFMAWPAAAPALGARSEETVRHTIEMARSFERMFGRRQLADLAPMEVAAWAAKHPAHARYARTIVGDAVAMGLLDASPFLGVRVARPAGRGEHVPSLEEVKALAEEGERFGLRAFTMVAASSGARLSALAGLQREDVALGPKPGALTLMLKRKGHEGVYPALLLRPGADELMVVAPERGRVFGTARGHRWDRRSVSRCWVQMRESVGLPPACTFHALRKSFATRLLDEGHSMMDVAFAMDHVDALGRPNVELVQRVYGRPDRGAALARLAA